MLIWGCISVAAKGVKNLAGLVALRFFLGVVEAGFLFVLPHFASEGSF